MKWLLQLLIDAYVWRRWVYPGTFGITSFARFRNMTSACRKLSGPYREGTWCARFGGNLL